MIDVLAAQEEINKARASIWRAVKIDQGRRALEGDIESAFHRLAEAGGWLKRDDIAQAQSTVAEAVELLSTEQSRLIAEDHDALDDAIGLLADIDWP
jgi:hypothetical protein